MDERTKADHPTFGPADEASLNRESWKVFQVMAEFVERLAKIKPSVSI